MGRLNKARYIERHGEDAWIIEQKKRNERSRKQKLKNKDKVREYQQKYYKEHKDELNLKHKERYQKLKNEHPEKCKEINKKQYWDNVDRHRAYNKYYQSTKEGRASSLLGRYKERDKRKETGCAITQKWILENIFNSKCIYCGDSNWKHLGADKIDNNLPHTPENCVCACGICNVEREHLAMSVEEFVEYRKTHPRDKEQPLEIIDEVVKPDGTIIKVIKKNHLF